MKINSKLITVPVFLGILFSVFTAMGAPASPRLHGPYAVVVAEDTAKDVHWAKVVEVLKEKYSATVITYERVDGIAWKGILKNVPAKLKELQPRYVCYVTEAKDASKILVNLAHQISRKLDDDPWADCIWGILTGYNASDALRIASAKPLEIKRVLGATSLRLECAEEGVWFSESNQTQMVRKVKGESPKKMTGPKDTTESLVKELSDGRAQLFITSGHASQRDWMPGYGYRNGVFKSFPGGKIAGIDLANNKYDIHSSEPRVYLPVGNCLIGDINSPDNCMALGYIHSAGVNQMVGYVEPTWYGYMGWGMLDYFYLQPGRYTVGEAFFANQQALLHRLYTAFPGILEAEKKDAQGIPRSDIKVNRSLSDKGRQMGISEHDLRGLIFDRDVVAFYGDPAWLSLMKDGPCRWMQTLDVSKPDSNGIYTFTFTITGTPCDITDENGSQRGGRPFLALFPMRIQNAEILNGADYEPLIADDFILVPQFKVKDGERYTIKFRAKIK